jgi:hypothetical protein
MLQLIEGNKPEGIGREEDGKPLCRSAGERSGAATSEIGAEFLQRTLKVQRQERSQGDGVCQEKHGQCFNSLMTLALEAKSRRCDAHDEVDARRQTRAARGSTHGQRKIGAAVEAAASVMAGASGNDVIRRYRRHVAANAKRLGRRDGGRKHKRRRGK